MTIGNFTEVLGQVSDFGITEFDSISGSDLQIIYGLDGDDNLNSTLTFAQAPLEKGFSTIILVGGSGRNNYQIRNNSVAIAIENKGDDDNILWTTIGSDGLSLLKETSFVATIDGHHLYLGDTVTNQYAILIDWQQPDNQIETFDFTEGFVSYEEFVATYKNSPNYLGNFTWEGLAARDEIDLSRLGISPQTIEEDINVVRQRAIELEVTSKGGIYGIGTNESEFIDGTTNNDYLQGNSGDDSLFGFGGSDTLVGGVGDDTYFIDWETGANSRIIDSEGTVDDLYIFARNSDVQTLSDNFNSDSFLDLRRDSSIYGDSAISLSTPKAGIIGLEKSGNNLIIDTNRNGFAIAQEDLTIVDFFTESGAVGNGRIERINNILNLEDIVDVVANSAKERFKTEDNNNRSIYRFYNSSLGTHFYTSDRFERDYVYDHLDDYAYEGKSYTGVDSLFEVGLVTTAVHRYFNKDAGTHLYTIDSNERNFVEQELNHFNYEGEVFFAYQSEVEGSIPIYRFYNSTTGAHFYTPSAVEKDFVANELTNFQSEGIAYYALSSIEDN